jgi:hypothetical protein
LILFIYCPKAVQERSREKRMYLNLTLCLKRNNEEQLKSEIIYVQCQKGIIDKSGGMQGDA